MPIPGPGVPISMTTIATEFGGTVPHSLTEYYRGGGLVNNTPTAASIPTSGTIAMGNFYGTAQSPLRVTIPIVLSTPQVGYDVYANRGPTYSPGASDIIVTVNPGVNIAAPSVPAYAMLVPSAFNAADTVTIINNGLITGSGGPAGVGAPIPAGTASNGSGGGNALLVQRPTIIQNAGTIAGGGGGGGGGGRAGPFTTPRPKKSGGPRTAVATGGGGGGGAGIPAGFGGPGGGAPAVGGNNGTNTTGGSGGAGQTNNPGINQAIGGPGGPGGGQGANGTAGTAGSTVPSPQTVTPGGTGGAAGNYIVGNPFVTWPVTGTRLGGVA